MTKFELIDKNALIRKFCAECQHCYRVDKAGGEPTMCKTVMMIAEMPTIEPRVLMIKSDSVRNLTDEETAVFEDWLNHDAAIEPEVRRGHWIFVGEETMPDGWTYRKYKCSECSFQTVEAKNFCQNCGVGMRGGNEGARID